MSATETDLVTAYLRRLGLAAPPPPDLATLTDLMARHLQTVPFENLDVVARRPRPLRTEAVLRKVAVESRGGFCYELNEAFRALLDRLGFRVRRIEARVWQASAKTFGAPYDHLALVVSLAEGEFLVDVGFGDNNRAPLRLPRDRSRDISGEYFLSPVSPDLSAPTQTTAQPFTTPLATTPQAISPQATMPQAKTSQATTPQSASPRATTPQISTSMSPSTSHRSPDEVLLRLSSTSQPLYEMTLTGQPLEAFFPMCRHHQTSPESIFSKGLICTLATPTGRITLSRDRLIRIDGGQRTETLITDTAAVLDEYFGIGAAGTGVDENIPHTT